MNLEEAIRIATLAKKWEHMPIPRAYRSYESITDDTTIAIAHFGIPKGASTFQHAQYPLNKIRNKLLFLLEPFGRRDEIMLSIKRNDAFETPLFLDFSQDENLVNLYRRIHKEYPPSRLHPKVTLI